MILLSRLAIAILFVIFFLRGDSGHKNLLKVADAALQLIVSGVELLYALSVWVA